MGTYVAAAGLVLLAALPLTSFDAVTWDATGVAAGIVAKGFAASATGTPTDTPAESTLTEASSGIDINGLSGTGSVTLYPLNSAYAPTRLEAINWDLLDPADPTKSAIPTITLNRARTVNAVVRIVKMPGGYSMRSVPTLIYGWVTVANAILKDEGAGIRIHVDASSIIDVTDKRLATDVSCTTSSATSTVPTAVTVAESAGYDPARLNIYVVSSITSSKDMGYTCRWPTSGATKVGIFITGKPAEDILAHEIGHALGLDHYDVHPNLMMGYTSGRADMTEGQTIRANYLGHSIARLGGAIRGLTSPIDIRLDYSLWRPRLIPSYH